MIDDSFNIVVDDVENNMLLNNVYVHLHASAVKCSSVHTPLMFYAFEQWITTNSEVDLISDYGIVTNEKLLLSFVTQLGFSEYYYCIVDELRKNRLLYQLPVKCSNKKSSNKFIMMPYFRNNWVDSSLFCL